ncbi:MAG: outer membrane protein assembly factor BamD [Planctomycetota bacterium]|nr:MAG: outer membrane protein assembly factor BamD [Planctomycetota bacterium]
MAAVFSMQILRTRSMAARALHAGVRGLWLLGILLGLTTTCPAEPIDDYNAALKFYEQKRWDFASKGFADFLKVAPQHPKAPLAQLYQGQALTHARRFDAGRAVFREFLKGHPQHPEAPLAAYRVGESSFFLNDFPAASEELSAYVAKYPNHELVPWGWQYLGESRLQQKDATGAVTALETVLKLRTGESEQVEAKFFLAQAQLQLGNNNQAISLYREVATASHPRAAEALFELGSRDYEALQFATSAQSFEEILTRFATSSLVPRAAQNAGYARYQAGDFAAAEAHFTKAIQDPKLELISRFWLGMSCKGQKKWPEAVQVFSEMAAKTPPPKDLDRVIYHWADCELQQEKWSEARKLFLDVATQFPNSDWADKAHYYAADAALREGQLGEAIRLAERFPNLFTTSENAIPNEHLLGRALLRRGDDNLLKAPKSAQADFQQAATLLKNVLAKTSSPKTQMTTRIQWARAEMRLNQPQEVVKALTPIADAIRLSEAGSGEFAEALPILADALLQLNQPAEAETVLTQAVANLPAGADRRPTLVKLVELRAKQNDWTRLIESLDQLAPLDTDRNLVTQSAALAADQAIGAKNWPIAEQLLTRVIASGPQSEYFLAGMSDLGMVLANQDRPAEAATCYAKVLESPVASPLILAQAAFNQGVCLEKDAGKDSVKLKTAADTLSQSATRFALPAENQTPTDAEKQIGEQAVRCAILSAELYRKLLLIDPADPMWAMAYNQSLKLPVEDPAQQTRPSRDEILRRWAVNHAESEKFLRAEELYTQLLKDYPQSDFAAEAKLFIAQGHDQEGRIDPARTLYKELTTSPDVAPEEKEQALASWMNLEARVESWPESGRLAQSLLTDFPQSEYVLLAQFRVGESQYHRGQYQPSLETLSGLLKQPALAAEAQPVIEWRPQLLLLIIESQFELKDYVAVQTAVADFQKQHSTGELADQANDILGRIAVKEARFDEARKFFSLVVDSPASRKTPLAAKAQFWLADTWITQNNKNYEEAIRAYTKLYANYAYPEFQSKALLQSAKCDMVLKNWENSRQTLETLIQEFPGLPETAEAQKLLETVRKQLPATTP